jgi:hypothetical protein
MRACVAQGHLAQKHVVVVLPLLRTPQQSGTARVIATARASQRWAHCFSAGAAVMQCSSPQCGTDKWQHVAGFVFCEF